MAFKSATVTASDIPSTQSNVPVYVNLSRAGVTTTAEANSVRVYSDSGKTTELAREIVSATEMWVKIPSLTSSFTIYIDWDGSRSDYAVTDTYGRNAVWSAYAFASHNGGQTDSTGNSTPTVSGATITTGNIGDASDFDGVNDLVTAPNNSIYNFGTGSFHSYAWIDPDDGNTQNIVSRVLNSGSFAGQLFYKWSSARIAFRPYSASGTSLVTQTSYSTGVWQEVVGRRSGSNIDVRINSSAGSTATNAANVNNSEPLTIGGNIPGWGIGWFNGRISEVRLGGFAPSDDFLTIQYNNTSDEAGFWGTWTDLGGGPSYRFVPQLTPFAGL